MNQTNVIQYLRNLFEIGCTLVACTLAVYWIYEFGLNKDLCSIDYRMYHDYDEDYYPSLSLCFPNFIDDHKLKEKLPQSNLSEYLSFLKGDVFDPNLLKIDFQSIATNVSDYLIKYIIDYRNQNMETLGTNKSLVAVTYNGNLWDHFVTCFSLNTPQEAQLEYLRVFLKNSMFPNQIRKPEKGMFSILHYPNQILLPGNPMKWSWQRREKYEKFTMRFKVDNMEVIRRRNKAQRPCQENWMDYDNSVLKEYLNGVGCRMPFHDANIIKLPLCNKSESIKKVWSEAPSLASLGKSKNIPPCKSMVKIGYRFDEGDLVTKNKQSEDSWKFRSNQFAVLLSYNPYFKEIVQER